MTYQGLTDAKDELHSHLGGNAVEGDPFTYAPSVWEYLVRRFAVDSVLDLGSGRGFSSHFFHKAGLKVIAVDGLADNVQNAVYPSIQVDLTQAKVNCRVDLVHCQEVVEHIDEKHLDNLLCSLACGRIIVMTNALPGQGGYHHVNEQPTEYWIGHLKRFHCEVLVEDSNRIRALAARDNAGYLARTGLVFSNKSRL
jgi:hypothetical protein